MRLSIRHETVHHFVPPAKSVIQSLRMTPRNHEGQHVVHWRIDVDAECRLKASHDAFGNVVHGFTSIGPHAAIAVTAIGEVDTFDTRGVINGAIERFPPELYLRSTPLTPANTARTLMTELKLAVEKDVLTRLHALLRGLFTRTSATLEQEQEMASRSPRDRAAAGTEIAAHAFIACARLLDVPARYVAGYRLIEANAPSAAMHGWAEAFVSGLGWVGFDPENGICPDDRYVRVAIGLDALGACATRAAHVGGGEPKMLVKLAVSQMRPRG
ncbi:MAG: transglutaminase family protein [Hyphomicrobiales bacterium]|nr:transglutaminase family protein [Hyphomicrobiales bacterium]